MDSSVSLEIFAAKSVFSTGIKRNCEDKENEI